MKKDLKDMTLEELWQLFPIVLAPHDPRWAQWAEEETACLYSILGGTGAAISHIGSTAIPGIQAKPIVDILVEVPENADHDDIRRRMEGEGYICMSEPGRRMSFNKGYTPEGYAERVFHIHFHPAGDNDEILFRDWLTAHREDAKEYERLKLSLLPAFRHDRDGYTEAKSEFVRRIIALAQTSGKISR